MTLLALAANVDAEVYKWVDEEGNVHYSDQPPLDAESERVQLDYTTGSNGDPSEALQRVLEQPETAAERRSEERQAASAGKEAERAARVAQDQRCLETRMQLAVLQEQLPVYRDEEGKFRARWRLRPDTYQGERKYLDDAARASEIERTQQHIRVNCQHPDDTQAQTLARTQWLRSEDCATARVELKELEMPSARTVTQELEEKREEVKRYCED